MSMPIKKKPPAHLSSSRKASSAIKCKGTFVAQVGMTSPETLDAHQSVNWFELIVEGAPDAILMADQTRRITLVNHSTEVLFGYSRAELIGRPLEILVPQRYRDRHPGLVETFFATPKARSMGAGRDLFGLRKDGTEVPIEIGLNPIETASGLYTLASIIDITERKRAEEGFRLVVEAAPNAMIMADKNGRITLVNRNAETLFGYSRAELLDQQLEILIPVRFRDRHPIFVSDYFAAPKARSMGTGRDLFGLRKDGTEVPIEIGLNPIEASGGWFTLASIIDITERRRAEEVQQLMASLIESADDAIVTKNLDGVIRSWNPGAERLLGYSAADIIGQSLQQLIPDDHQDEERMILDGIRDGKRFAHFETVRRRNDGSLVDVSLTISPIYNRAGMVVGGSTIMRDITERKRTEQALQESELRFRATLEQRVADRTSELEAFSYTVSHDLRAPLRHLHGYVELLTQETAASPLPEAARRYIQTITDVSSEMGQLIDDLLAFSRMGNVDLRQTRVRPNELVRESIDSLRMATRDRNIEWQIASLPEVLGDTATLKQVFLNLIGNAIKYTRPRDPAHIEIGCFGEENGRLILFVRDNGVGFEMQYAHKLFGVFQRLHRAKDFEGTGIGLAIVRRIVARHEGRVWAEGVANKGATFYFTLQSASPK
jgi:PAS domain S-box-containing protein